MEIKQIQDKSKWEKFISLYSPQSFFQSWNWGETIIQSQQHNTTLWRYGIHDKNELVGIAQIVKIKAKRGTYLHIRHGPIFNKLNSKYIDFFINYIKGFGQKEKAGFIRISPLIENTPSNISTYKAYGFRYSPIHRIDSEVCWVLDLDKNEDELLSGMRKTTRYLVRLAQKMGVKIEKTTDVKDLDKFIDLYNQTAQRQGFVKHTGIYEEFRQFRKDNQIVLYKGFYQNKLLAAALVIFYNHQAIYHHSASIQQKIPVNYLLQWEVIKDAKKRGLNVYNFWGIAPEDRKNHPWQGLTLFKKGFGGRTVEYMHALDLPLSYLYCTTYIIEWLRKISKGY